MVSVDASDRQRLIQPVVAQPVIHDLRSTALVAPAYAVYLIHANIVLYAMLWWFGQPVFPYLSSSLGADPVMVGYLQSSSSLFQLIGAPFMGRLIDTRSPKLALIISHSCAAVSYLMLSMAWSVPSLFASQLPTVFLAAMHSSQAYMTLLSSTDSRAAALGSLGLSYGVGMIIGPTLGGFASTLITYQQMALVTAVASAGLTLALFILLPDITAPKKVTTAAPSSFGAVFALLSVPLIRNIIIIKLFAGTAISTYRSSFVLLAKDTYHLTPEQNGYITSFAAVLGAFVQSVGVAFLSARATDYTIVTCCLVVLTASLAFIPAATSLPLLILTVVPISLTGATITTVLTGLLTKSAALSDAGLVLGLDMGVGTFTRVISPPLGGAALEYGSQIAIGLFTSVCAGISVLIAVWTGGVGWKETKSTETPADERKKEL